MTISEKIQRYRDYQDDDEMYLYYFYIGMQTAQEHGYSERIVDLLDKGENSISVNGFLKGYLEGS